MMPFDFKSTNASFVYSSDINGLINIVFTVHISILKQNKKIRKELKI